MAKRGRRPASGDSALQGFAEDLGRLLGTARAKAEGWLGQRQNVAKQLEQIRDTAAGLLTQITGTPGRRRRGRARSPQPVVPMGTTHGKKPRREPSAKAGAANSRAQKKRRAKRRADQNK